MVNHCGVSKGLQQVLQEHSLDTQKVKNKDMVEWLQQLDDFRYELNLINDLGHQCISLPKVNSTCAYFLYQSEISYTVP